MINLSLSPALAFRRYETVSSGLASVARAVNTTPTVFSGTIYSTTSPTNTASTLILTVTSLARPAEPSFVAVIKTVIAPPSALSSTVPALRRSVVPIISNRSSSVLSLSASSLTTATRAISTPMVTSPSATEVTTSVINMLDATYSTLPAPPK